MSLAVAYCVFATPAPQQPQRRRQPDTLSPPPHLHPAHQNPRQQQRTSYPQNQSHSNATTSPPHQPQLNKPTQPATFKTQPHHPCTSGQPQNSPKSLDLLCFVGRSNVGKSSLLNAVFGRPKEKIARVSSKAGHTKTLNAFGVGGNSRDVAAKDTLKQLQQGALVVVDTPGYGYHSRQEWGPEINKFFEKRKQLRMVFLLIDALHGIKPRDLVLLQHFEMQGIPYQIILSKVDRIVMTDSKVPGAEKLGRQVAKLDKIYEEVEEQLGSLDQGKRRKKRDVLAASAEKQIKGLQGWGGGAKIGIEAVRWAVLKACGLDCDEQGNRRVVESYQIQDEDEGDEEVVAWRPQN
ncbi:hypothetical protein E4T44_04430 [Aureobasidium sp. EXF-8845]|nr:hypothetical protein E4T44_04430 [Aureobasidium sp. EXF-8845]KAI4853266.1 hypothetical protein E4T45_04399 [Aureobasidium sp. EXF-8846]